MKSLEENSGEKESDHDREEKKEKAEQHKHASPLEEFQEKVGNIFFGSTDSPGFGAANRDLARLSFMVQSGDAAPSAPLLASLEESCSGLSAAIEKWRSLTQSLPEVNAFLTQQKLAPLPALPVLPISPGGTCVP